MPTIDSGWPDQHQRFPPPGHNHRKNSQSRRSDGRKRRFERARTPSWWRRARVSSRRSLRVARADRTAAPVRKTSRIARRVPSGDANVNDYCPDAILARHTRCTMISQLNVLATELGELPAKALERPDAIEDFKARYANRAVATTNRYLARLRHVATGRSDASY